MLLLLLLLLMLCCCYCCCSCYCLPRLLLLLLLPRVVAAAAAGAAPIAPLTLLLQRQFLVLLLLLPFLHLPLFLLFLLLRLLSALLPPVTAVFMLPLARCLWMLVLQLPPAGCCCQPVVCCHLLPPLRLQPLLLPHATVAVSGVAVHSCLYLRAVCAAAACRLRDAVADVAASECSMCSELLLCAAQAVLCAGVSARPPPNPTRGLRG